MHTLLKKAISMFRFTIAENPSRELWDSVLERVNEGNLEQTYEYGEAMKTAYPRIKVLRFLAMDGKNPIGVLQGFYRKKFGFGRLVTARDAPLTIMKGDERVSAVTSLLVALEKYAREHRVIEAQVYWPERWGMQEVLQDLRYRCVRRFNVFTVSLKRSVDDLWDNIGSNKRKNIRKATKSGVQVKEAKGHEDFLYFYKMLETTGRRAGFNPPTFSELDAIWEAYVPRGLGRIFFAEFKGENIAGVFTVTHGDTVYAKAAASLESAWSVRPNDLLHWEAMKWACEQEFSNYHMGVVPEPIPECGSPQWGVWRWKREWNGRLQKLLVYDRVFLSITEKVVSWAERMKKSLGRVF